MIHTVDFKRLIDPKDAHITFHGTFMGENLGSRNWRLLADIDVLKDGVKWFTLPAGFITDLLSTPRFAWIFFDPEAPKWIHAAVMHDFLYDIRCPVVCTRREADRALIAGGRSGGACFGQRVAVYFGVRVGGKGRFRCGPTGIPDDVLK